MSASRYNSTERALAKKLRADAWPDIISAKHPPKGCEIGSVRLLDGTHYRPDFITGMRRDDRLRVFWECCRGGETAAAKTRIARAADAGLLHLGDHEHPIYFIIAHLQGDTWIKEDVVVRSPADKETPPRGWL